jgi:hypothetical protein
MKAITVLHFLMQQIQSAAERTAAQADCVLQEK